MSGFFLLREYLTSTLEFHIDEYEEKRRQRDSRSSCKGKSSSSPGSSCWMEMPVNPTGLTDGEVGTTLVQMAQAIILQAQAMTT